MLVHASTSPSLTLRGGSLSCGRTDCRHLKRWEKERLKLPPSSLGLVPEAPWEPRVCKSGNFQKFFRVLHFFQKRDIFVHLFSYFCWFFSIFPKLLENFQLLLDPTGMCHPGPLPSSANARSSEWPLPFRVHYSWHPDSECSLFHYVDIQLNSFTLNYILMEFNNSWNSF